MGSITKLFVNLFKAVKGVCYLGFLDIKSESLLFGFVEYVFTTWALL